MKTIICVHCHGLGKIKTKKQCPGNCFGTGINLSYDVPIDCDQCEGTGKLWETCRICKGLTRVTVRSKL